MRVNQLLFTAIPPRVVNAQVTYAFSLEGRLKEIQFNEDAPPKFKKIAATEAPVSITYSRGEIPPEFKPMLDAGVIVKDVSEFDFSFESFWNLYNYKLGNIQRCKKLFKVLKFEDMILAFAFIPRYRVYCQRSGTAMLYPERYIAYRKWENVLPTV